MAQRAIPTSQGTGRLSSIALAAVLVIAGGLRLTAAVRLPSHVDETASALAARMVAERGLPLFPSGLLYLQGASLSYLSAPLVWLAGDSVDLLPLRLISVLAGTAAVFALTRLVQEVSGKWAVGLLAGLLLAIDPNSVRWSAYVRMYALLQLLAIVLVLLFLRAVWREHNEGVLWEFVALWFVAVFTHVAALLLWPALVLVAGVVHRRALLTTQRGLTFSLALVPLAPLALLGLNRLAESPGRPTADALGDVDFVGDYFVDLDRLLHPRFRAWELLFHRGDLAGWLPPLLIAVSLGLTILFGLTLLGRMPSGRRPTPPVLATLLAVYWVPILLVAAFAREAHDRYLLHVHPFGIALVVSCAYALVVVALARTGQHEPRDALSHPTSGARHRTGHRPGWNSHVSAAQATSRTPELDRQPDPAPYRGR